MKKVKPEHIGKRIKKIRAYNGMTQEELALAINKTRAMVSHIERTGEVNFYTLREISKVLNTSVEQLQDDSEVNHNMLNEPQSKGFSTNSPQDMILQLQQENNFLKETIQNQWKLLFELSK